jgi:hypothetical protein
LSDDSSTSLRSCSVEYASSWIVTIFPGAVGIVTDENHALERPLRRFLSENIEAASLFLKIAMRS